MSFRSSSIPAVATSLSTEATKVLEDDKLLKGAMQVLKANQFDLEDLHHFSKNDCLWMAFTLPPYQLSIRAVYLLRRKYSYHEVAQGEPSQQQEVTAALTSTSSAATSKQRKKRKTFGASVSPMTSSVSVPTIPALTSSAGTTSTAPKQQEAMITSFSQITAPHSTDISSNTISTSSSSNSSSSLSGLANNKLQQFRTKVESKQLASTTIPKAADTPFAKNVEKLTELFNSSNFDDIKEALLLEGFREIDIEEGNEEIVEGLTYMNDSAAK